MSIMDEQIVYFFNVVLYSTYLYTYAYYTPIFTTDVIEFLYDSLVNGKKTSILLSLYPFDADLNYSMFSLNFISLSFIVGQAKVSNDTLNVR